MPYLFRKENVANMVCSKFYYQNMANNTMNYKIYDLKGRIIENIVSDILERFDIFSKINKNSKVLIKPNLCVGKSYQTGATSDFRIIESLCKFLHKKCNLIIAESSGRGMDAEKILRDLGYYNLSKKYDVQVMDLNKDKLLDKDGIEIFETVLNSDFIINTTPMKTHTNSLVTLSMKNLMGCLSYKEKADFHINGLTENIVKLNQIIKSNLIILGGQYGLEGNGPVYGCPKEVNTIIASDDSFLADYIAINMMGFRLEEIKHLYFYFNLNKNLYSTLLSKINVIKKPFKKPLISLSHPCLNYMDKIAAYLDKKISLNIGKILNSVMGVLINNHPIIDTKLCTFCNNCIKACPEDSIIKKKNIGLKITNKCKSCNICIEFCPQQAIFYK